MGATMSDAPLMTYAAVENALGLSRMTVRKLVNSGDLPVVRFGRAVRFRPEDVAKLRRSGGTTSDE
jgi:excisionase family DNA binding protein